MRILLRLAMLGILILSLSACLARHNLQEGINNFLHQEYRQAFVRLKPEAERGNPEAMYAVGYMYYYGAGVVEDRRRACMWISQAAKAGHPKAIAALKILKETSGYVMDSRIYG